MNVHRMGQANQIIAEMQASYGIRPRAPMEQPVEEGLEGCQNLPPMIKTSEKSVREASRAFASRPIQFPPQHPILMLATYIFNFVKRALENFFNKKAISIKKDITFFSNSAKNHGYISLKECIALKHALSGSQEEVKDALKNIIETLYQNRRVNRKIYLHLISLAHQNKALECMRFVFALSSVSSIHQFSDELKEIVQPEEQLKMLEFLKGAYDDSTFTEESLDALAMLNARLVTYRWVNTDPNNSREKQELLSTLQNQDPASFTNAMKAYLSSRSYRTSGAEHQYIQELLASFDTTNTENSFIHFAQALETLAIMHEWQEKAKALRQALEPLANVQDPLTEEQAHLLLEDMKELYTIFGKIIENEKEWSASPLVMGVQQGILSAEWKKIGRLLAGIVKKEKSHNGHNLCGCMFDPDIQGQEAWPDVENTEIRPASPPYEPNRPQQESDKKINVLGFYCNWGAGHRSAMKAMADFLGPEFHISTVDLPQTTLLPLDMVNQIAGDPHSTSTLYNTMMAGRHYKWLSFLQKQTHDAPSESYKKGVHSLIREQLLKQRPDIIIVDYAHHAPYILDVAQELGIPMLRVHTDMDVSQDGLDTHPHAVPHFKKIIPYGIPDALETLDSYYTREQIEVSGYPVRPAFLTLMKNIESDPNVLKNLRNKYGIKDDEIVYLASNGGRGAENTYAEQLISSPKGSIPKGHLFVVTGRNEKFKQSLEQFANKCTSRNSDISLHIEGFLNETEMAELQALAASQAPASQKRGVFIGKAGGGSIAEALIMQTQMLLDTSEGEQSAPWEAYTAAELQKRDLADILINKKSFLQQINERASKGPSDYTIFQEKNPESRFYEIVKDMVDKSKNDPIFAAKRSCWKTNDVFMRGIRERAKPLSYFESLSFLNTSLKDLTPMQPIICDNETAVALQQKKPCSIDFKTMRLVETQKHDPYNTRLTVRAYIHHLEHALQNPLEDNHELLRIAGLYFDLVHSLHRSQLDKGVRACKKDPLLMDIAYLDRLLGAMKLKEIYPTAAELGHFIHQNSEETSFLLVKNMYKTAVAQEQLQTWTDEKTAHGRNKNLDETILRKPEALISFALHPEQYNWIRDLRIHRAASTFNHRLEVNENGELLILRNGCEESVSELINTSLTSIGNRIVDAATGNEYTYDYQKGLCQIDKNNDPDHWKESLPIFKKKERVHADYRLEIVTDTGSDPEFGAQKHGWIRLKSPDGSIYSVGRFWDPDIVFPSITEVTQLLPGHLRAGDLHEFMPRAKGKNIAVTKIDLGSEENFLKVKNYIEKQQKSGQGFNLINQNCVSFVKDVCKQLNINVKSKISVTEYFLPLPLKTRKWLLMSSWAGAISSVILYPLTILSNIIMGVFGAFKRHILAHKDKKALFHSVDAFLDPRGLVDSPAQLRVWQECVQDLCGKKIIPLNELRERLP